MRRPLDLLTSRVASAVRAGQGRTVGVLGPRPTHRLTLYDVEGCPWSRPVREALTTLDLEALILPCPIGGTRFLGELERVGGKGSVPYLVDPGAGVAMYESDAILDHLHRSYGAEPAARGSRSPILRWAAPIIRLARQDRGTHARPSRAPPEPLELWAFEACPFCRIVRETLCELELPHIHHPLGKGSPARPEFRAANGKIQVPFLVDPNTGVRMFESADILVYLEERYGGLG